MRMKARGRWACQRDGLHLRAVCARAGADGPGSAWNNAEEEDDETIVSPGLAMRPLEAI